MTQRFNTRDGRTVQLVDVPARNQESRRVDLRVFNSRGEFLPTQSLTFDVTTFLALVTEGVELFGDSGMVESALGINPPYTPASAVEPEPTDNVVVPFRGRR